MTAYLLVAERQRHVGEEICRYLEELLVKASLFTKEDDFWASLSLAKENQIDFAMIDFSLYQLDLFNPYEEMLSLNHQVPIVLYNDPYPPPEERAVYWKIKNRHYFTSLMTESRTKGLMPVWKKIQDFLNGEINKKVSIICQPEEDEDDNPLPRPELFCARHGMSSSRQKLLSYFLSHIGESLTTEELCVQLWENANPSHTKSLYTYIHEIREALAKDSSVQLKIQHEDKDCYVMKKTDDTSMPVYRTAAEYFIQKKKYSFNFTPKDEEYMKKWK